LNHFTVPFTNVAIKIPFFYNWYIVSKFK